jgi:hypothetical protein
MNNANISSYGAHNSTTYEHLQREACNQALKLQFRAACKLLSLNLRTTLRPATYFAARNPWDHLVSQLHRSHIARAWPRLPCLHHHQQDARQSPDLCRLLPEKETT